jgi:hypothetical protein
VCTYAWKFVTPSYMCAFELCQLIWTGGSKRNLHAWFSQFQDNRSQTSLREISLNRGCNLIQFARNTESIFMTWKLLGNVAWQAPAVQRAPPWTCPIVQFSASHHSLQYSYLSGPANQDNFEWTNCSNCTNNIYQYYETCERNIIVRTNNIF